MAGHKTERLLRRVAVRHWVERFLGRFFVLSLALAGLYALLLCAERFFSLAPDLHVALWTIAAPFALALLGAAAFTWPAKTERIARLVDNRAGAKDLFLTSVLIDHAFGDYKPLVLEQAETLAPEVRPRQVAPVRFVQRLLIVLLAAGVLLAGVKYLPRFDPFGRNEERQKEAERRRKVEEARKIAALQTELLKKKDSDAALSKEVSDKLEHLKGTLQQAKPDQPKANFAAIQQDKKGLGEEFRKLQERRLAEALDRHPMAQDFGKMTAQAGEWKDQLKQGNVEGIRNELQELMKLAEKLQAMPEGLEKEKARQELKERMQGMANFMAKQANNRPMKNALDAAIEQLALAQTKGLEKEAMEALKDNLGLTEMEAKALAQNIRDLKALEEGLKAAQLAQQLNAKGELDGADLQEAADYEALYAALMAKMGNGNGMGNGAGMGMGMGQGQGQGQGQGLGGMGGPGQGQGQGLGGMGGPGQGQGGIAPEDETLASAFTPEKDIGKMVPGKMLMEWKTQELPEPGKARELFIAGIEQARQEASEAVVKEEIPPGYHEAISKYFDKLGEEEDVAAP